MQRLDTRAQPSLPMRLVMLADYALTLKALQAGLRTNETFAFIGHADPLTTSVTTIIGARPEVVLLDDMDRADRAVELIAELSAADSGLRIIVLASELDDAWLERIFAAGATGAISKDTHPRVIGMLLGETVKGHVFHTFARMRPTGDRRQTSVSAVECPPASKRPPLTSRQLEILRLVAAGSTNSEVARELWVTEPTVKFHLRNIYRKLDVTNRTEASYIAHVNGLINERPELRLVS